MRNCCSGVKCCKKPNTFGSKASNTNVNQSRLSIVGLLIFYWLNFSNITNERFSKSDKRVIMKQSIPPEIYDPWWNKKCLKPVVNLHSLCHQPLHRAIILKQNVHGIGKIFEAEFVSTTNNVVVSYRSDFRFLSLSTLELMVLYESEQFTYHINGTCYIFPKSSSTDWRVNRVNTIVDIGYMYVILQAVGRTFNFHYAVLRVSGSAARNWNIYELTASQHTTGLSGAMPVKW